MWSPRRESCDPCWIISVGYLDDVTRDVISDDVGPIRPEESRRRIVENTAAARQVARVSCQYGANRIDDCVLNERGTPSSAHHCVRNMVADLERKPRYSSHDLETLYVCLRRV